MNFHSAKNAKIIRVCAKLHNYVIRKAKEIGDLAGNVANMSAKCWQQAQMELREKDFFSFCGEDG